ncbi:hypothetical protein [Sclerotinia sclerotiorum fusarivirus 1]|uniref:Uncharacterized protein n=1 Tax=Sclerotinia sclerotiorum fusarivirus 1 TaxID=1661062 RepID=A0A0G3BFZ2_9VIRU|nr:hypothetical protein [Sclerotinia sclerotiorum fusarivirus 1]AKJ26311.1 hypothetical protein [Sclerotinia sclerotiorum fusarivirus 1]
MGKLYLFLISFCKFYIFFKYLPTGLQLT